VDVRKLWIILTFASLKFALPAVGQEKRALTDIRQIDFRNFQYPWETATTPENFHWLTRFDTTLSLKDGEHVFHDGACGGPYQRCAAVSIAEIQYADINDDLVQDAIIVLTYKSGGTAYWEYVYMYTTVNGTSRLIAAFETGTRAYNGLHRVYPGNGHLIVELNEPDENEGECCATWRSRTEYRWSRDHFVAVAEPVKELIPPHERTWYVAR
jgi:hypothetical protein